MAVLLQSSLLLKSFFSSVNARKSQCVLAIPPGRPSTQPFSNAQKKTNTEVVFMENTLFKTDTIAELCCFCFFV